MYTIERRTGNSTYIYEVTSYWDAEKKQPRQRRKYLGKKDPTTGQPVRPRRDKTPRLSKDYGHVYLLQHIVDQLGLTQLLKNAFPQDYQRILALVFFEISEAAPLYLFPYWLESTWFEGVKSLSSSDLTPFTQHIGQMERARLEFCHAWVTQSGQVRTVVFDITSLSSYSELFEYIEWGYNRDKEKLPQLNLGVIYAENTNLPLYYHIYPGSIPDVKTLKNILTYLELFELQDILFITDRGFYSANNILKLHESGIKFIMPLPRTVTAFSRLVSQNKRTLSHLKNAFVFKEEILFHVQEPLEVQHISLESHLYFSPQKRTTQTTHFLKKLLTLEAAAIAEGFHHKKDARDFLKGHAKFFHMTLKDGQVDLIRKTNTLSTQMANMGVTIMLTNKQGLERAHILTLYRQKDYLEKTFDVLKNEFDGNRLRASSREAVEGRLFVKFIGLILYAALGNQMRKTALFTKYSVREIMYELKKLRMVELYNGKQYLTEISKRQREIFRQFDVDIPNIET